MSLLTNAMGTTLKKNATTIAHLTSISGLELTSETIDVTALDSSTGYKEFLEGSNDAGEVKVKGFFNGADHEVLWIAFNTSASDTYTITFSEGSKWTFTAWVTGYSTGGEVDNAVSFEATLKVTGAPSFLVPPPTSVVLDSSANITITVAGGASHTSQALAHILPNGAYQTFTYLSSAPATATVSATGLITAVAIGSCTVTVKSAVDPTKTQVINVTVTA